jgi:hypothetical protein
MHLLTIVSTCDDVFLTVAPNTHISARNIGNKHAIARVRLLHESKLKLSVFLLYRVYQKEVIELQRAIVSELLCV